jgi:Na+-translocating ferredoxin:NAD+ oxidoreductase RnfG subunit
MRVSVATSLSLALFVPGVVAYAADYLTLEQSQKQLFPEADRFSHQQIVLNASQQQAIESLSGLPIRSTKWQIISAHKGNEILGYLLADNVIGKFELITYAVALDSLGNVRQVEILSYRESHGYEIRLPAWRKQFIGKSVKSPLRVGSDIANISGATLSCNHVTDGIRRIVAIVRTCLDNKIL